MIDEKGNVKLRVVIRLASGLVRQVSRTMLLKIELCVRYKNAARVDLPAQANFLRCARVI